MSDAIEPVAAFCSDHELPWTQSRQERFAEYLELLEQFGDSMNLIGDLASGEIVRELFVDSLTPAAVRPPEGTVLDIGTGAGFPGVPLKIVFPEIALTLVEPRRKRSTFLRIVRNRLDLADVQIERTRVEQFPEGIYDYVVSKAFRPPDAWLEVAAAFTAQEGVAVCMTSREDRALVDRGAESAGLEIVASVEADELGVPGGAASRRCVVILAPARDRG